MPKFPEPRPSFKNPPVIEVVLGVQFEPLQRLEIPHYGLFWSKIRDRFPNAETKSPLNAHVESFGTVAKQEMSIQLLAEFPSPRLWFSNEPGTELLQVQQDRFIFNWRQRNDSPYPRYERVRERFLELSQQFIEFLSSEGIGKIVPNQSEVTYVNHLLRGGLFQERGILEQAFSLWSGKTSDGFLPLPEDASFRTSYRLLADDTGEPFGRLHATVEPRIRAADQERLVRLTLTARGLPRPADMNGVLDFFDLGREYVVRGFASLTTPEMHKEWRREDV